jgi:hypothetical protein
MMFCLAILSLTGSVSSFAAESGKASAAKAPITFDNFQCGKFLMPSVADLKQKLLEYCDLTVPFSFSTNNPIGADTTAIYCCVKKQ